LTLGTNVLLSVDFFLEGAKFVGKWTWKHRYTIGTGRKNRGVLGLSDELSLEEKQSKGAEYTNIIRTEKVDDKIKLAIHNCKSKNIEPNHLNLTKNGLSESTYFKYKSAVENWVRLLT